MTFTFLIPENEQLIVLAVMLKSLRMSGVGECHFGARLPEGSEVLQMRRRFAGFREGDSIESSLIYTTRYFSRYELAAILERLRPGVAHLLRGGEFIYPPREEVFVSLQALCGEPSVDERIRKVACSAYSVGIQRFHCFARLLFHLSFVKNALTNYEKALYRESLMCYDAMFAALGEKQESKLRSSLEWARARSATSSSEVEYSTTQPSEVMMKETVNGNELFSDKED